MRSIRTAIVSLLVVAGCKGSDHGPHDRAYGATEPRYGGTLTFANYTNVRTMDPAIAYDENSIYCLNFFYDTLVSYEAADPDRPGSGTALVPQLAESWTISPDGLVYDFTLRPGLTYSNGAPVHAADFVYAIHRIQRREDSPFTQFIAGIKDVAAPDDRHVRFTLDHPDAAFLYVLAMKFATPLDQAFVEAHGDDLRRAVLGTGPFVMGSWSEGERVVFDRNPNYWDHRLPYLDHIVFLENIPNDTAFLMFEDGELDTIDRLPSPDWLWIVEREDWKPYIHTIPQMSVYGERMNVRVKPFDDVRVRRALNYAVDKDHLIKVQNGLAVASHGLLPPGMFGRDDSLEPYPHDPAKAKELLAEAGYPDGFDVDYVTLQDDKAVKLAQSMQADLAEVGVRVKITQMSFATYLTATGKPDGPAFSYGSWLQDYPDPSDFLDVKFSTSQIADENSNNDTFYSNPALDKMLEQAHAELDQGKRAALYHQIERILYDDAPWIWEYHPVVMEVVQPYVKHFAQHPVWVRDYREVWLDLDPDGKRVPK